LMGMVISSGVDRNRYTPFEFLEQKDAKVTKGLD